MVHRTSFIVSGAISSAALFAHTLGTINAIIALRFLTSTLVLSNIERIITERSRGNAHIVAAFPAALRHSWLRSQLLVDYFSQNRNIAL